MIFEVRGADPEDAQAIKEITKEAFLKYIELSGIQGKVAAIEESLEDIVQDIKTKHVFVAYIDHVPVGSVRVEIFEDGTAYFSRFGVRLVYQNNGVGKALMNVVDMHMKQLKVKKLLLHTASKFFSLMRFYYGRGFYVQSTTQDRGYIRASLCKDYE
ncbi:MAG: GNAT family N-acetyltransferase [Hyphomonadaceae bacterium]|nr:GNAT family N-acetyltransferase [Clostridia bacterium]